MGDGGERVLMGDGVSNTRLDGWWEGAGASWWVMGIALWGAWINGKIVSIQLIDADSGGIGIRYG